MLNTWTFKSLTLFLVFFLNIGYAFDMERRKDQFSYTPGYFLAPVPYSIPGIGSGLFLFGLATNINDTQTDLLANIITGDVDAHILAISDYYIVDEHLRAELLHGSFDKASFQSYSTRGMDSDGENYVNIAIDKMSFTGAKLTASFYEKMLEFYYMGYGTKFAIDKINDKDGNLILDASGTNTQKLETHVGGFMVDYTDDRLDPRKGIRFDSSIDYSTSDSDEGINYF